MSGYLQRLAERALGQSRPLRTLAPQRGSGEEAPVQVDEPSAPLPHSVARTQAMPAFVHVPHSNEEARQQPGLLQDSNTAPGEPPAVRRTATADKAPNVQSQTPSVSTEGIAIRADADGTPSAPWPQEPLPLLALKPLHGTSQALAQLGPMAQQADATHAGVDTAPPDGPAVRMPSPQLPRTEHHTQVPSPNRALHPHPVQSSARRPTKASEETTEVHVTIGRIEVTAVQEAPMQKPSSRRRPAPMSLDEYIARRQGGRA
jgi:hypothetical protein